MFFYFKLLLPAKYKLSVHFIAFSGEKVVFSEAGEKYAQVKYRLQAKTVKNISKQIYWWILRKHYYGL